VIDVGSVDEVPPGTAMHADLEGTPVCVVNVDGTLHAIHDTCTHALESLCGGWIDGERIECPRHGAYFSVVTGEALTPGEKKQLLPASTPRIDLRLKQGDEVKVGARAAKVIEIAGHSPGGICLHFPAEKLLLAGDSLQKGGLARTGLPHGAKTPDTLVSAVKTKLLTLPDDTAVLPGHGPATTIGEERAGNPWFRPPPRPEKKSARPEPEKKKR